MVRLTGIRSRRIMVAGSEHTPAFLMVIFVLPKRPEGLPGTEFKEQV